MNLTIPSTKVLHATHMKMVLPVWYGNEDIPHDFPGREGKNLTLLVDLDTGIIQGWPRGRSETCYMKVVDEGTYILLDGKVTIKSLRDYVPSCIPGEFGDYVNLEIDGDGRIKDWPTDPAHFVACFYA